MKPSPDSNDARWAQLAARARADQPPPLDVSAALRAARTAAATPATAAPRSVLDDFAALFATPRRLAGCGGFAAVTLALATWYGLGVWTQLEPWADLLWSAMEGSV